MGLQVKLAHALDEQVHDLESRTLKRPIIVGRSAEADLRVPSRSVSDRHCILFVHDGRWMLQSLASGGTTTVNGLPLKGAAALRIGDRIVVGDAPGQVTIEIDPAGASAGRVGTPALDGAGGPIPLAAKPQNRAGVSAPLDPRLVPRIPRPAAAPPRVPREIPLAPPVPQTAPVAPDDLDMLQYAAKSSPRKKPRRKKSGSGGAIVACILAFGAIVSVVYYVINRHPIPPEAPAPVALLNRPPPAPPVEEQEEHVRFHKNVFTSDPTSKDVQVPQTDPSAPPAEIIAAAGAAGLQRDPTSGPAAARPGDTEITWNEVLDSADLNDEGLTILRIDDYAHTHPGQHAQELAELKANAIDALWWKRVTQLYNRAKRVKTDIAGKNKDLNDETNEAFRRQLIAERSELQKQLDQVRGVLKDDMGYAAETAPKTDSKAALAAARTARDAAAYATWSKSLRAFIRAHNGQTPWIGED